MDVDRSGSAGTTSTSNSVLIGAFVLLFASSAATTIYLCRTMGAGMPMDGAWTMSMAWMRMPGETWSLAAASFVAMWTVMMVAMMLPPQTPALIAFHRSLDASSAREAGMLTAVAAAGYFSVWIVFGAAVYPAGAMLAMLEMQSPAVARSVPLATAVAILIAGLVQLTPWKARELARCRTPALLEQASPPAWRAWRHGIDAGVHCALCCAGFMTILLVAGVMDLGVMTAVALAIAIERLAPNPPRVARIAGAVIVAIGVASIGRALS
jgi:predicted metal-binding membrane protein